ncbi:MAG: ATP-binding protein, partial [Bacteroidota bacterium]
MLIICSSYSQLLLGQSIPLELTENYYQDSLHQWYDLKPHLDFQKELPVNFDPTAQTFLDEWQPLSPTRNPVWNNNVWLRLPIDNHTNNSKDLILLLHADLLDVWYQDTNQNWQHQTGGNLRPRAFWDSRQHQPEYVSPHTVQFTISPNRTTTLFIKMGATDSNKTLNPMLCNRPFFLDHSTHYFQRTIATQSFFHGVLLIMLLFPFGMFLLNKDLAYLFYAGYTFSISIFLGYTFEFQNFTFLAEFPRLGRVLTNLSRFAFPLFYNLFLIYFLHQNDWRKDLQKLIEYFNKALFMVGIISTLGLIFLPPALFKMTHTGWITLPISLIGLGGLVYLSWQYWRSNNQLSRFIALNNLFMLIGLTVSLLVFYAGAVGIFDGRKAAFWGILFLEGTIVLQLLSFSLSLSYKGLETEREKVKLQELDELKSRFFANISHEFRTPLTLILGPVQQLKATANNPTERQQLRTAEKYAQNLLRLVNQILDLTKLEVGKMQLEPQVFDWVHMAKVITYSFASAAQQKQIELQFKSELPKLLVQLDQSKMEQILINLLANALKFTSEGGKIEVKSNFSAKKKVLQLIVQDNGIGISEEQQQYIFQHFYQANHGDFTVNQPSSGIGLSLTKELVDLHGGTIQVKSQRGKGTSFIIDIPLADLPENLFVSDDFELVDELVVPNVSDVLKTSDTLETTTTNQPIILIIEDHPDIQQYIQSCLVKNYQLLLANDGEEGIQIALEKVPDLIITDVMMP